MKIIEKLKSRKYELVTKEERFNLTQNISVADVKQYLLDEYDRAFKRENTIKDLEQQIEELLKVQVEYQAMCVASDKTRERLIASEKEVNQLKEEKKKLKEDIRALKNTNNNIELNYKKYLEELKSQIKSLEKDLSKANKVKVSKEKPKKVRRSSKEVL